ncbi:hypothetical protein I0C86_04575 [Plantactinospora sp. S1510]|uniref:Uncharacterized protein n=1 Tax=Plantactinospora alkalitolerans TaxID=2789879 RepID=A0ABS0GQL6_9ACTN|nr:hypothetical protein [Plantactinospora alkalitolerans]MBF9128273.1 hypothetical protein [Plantactinospora alkalitolerans]
MSVLRVPDPAAALRDFVARVSPYDPEPAAGPVGSVDVRTGDGVETILVTPHLARALAEALAGYRDRADRGTCASCGGRRLDENLHCADCGRLHGVLGEVIASQAERVRLGEPAGSGDAAP